MLFYFVATVGFITILASFSSAVRRDLFKPEYSMWRVLAYCSVYTLFDEVVGLPIKGMNTLETVGVITLAVALLYPLVLLGQHYTNRWWRVQRATEHSTLTRRW